MTKSRGRRSRRFLGTFVWSIIPILGLATVAAYFGLAVDRHVYPPIVPVAGTSMNPLLHFGDLVLLKRAEIGQLHKGDIIAFRTTADVQQKWDVPGSYVHRIVAVETGAYGQQFQTKGDNVGGKDPFWTVEQNVIGVYAGKINGAGYPVLFFRSRQGKILLGGALLILFLYWLLGVFERRREADAINVNNLATIVGEARRITQRMENVTLVPRAPPAEFDNMAALPSSDVNQETLHQLVDAIGEYGQHLQSHTAVMKNLASTTAELQGATMEMRDAISTSPRLQAVPISQMPKLKRSLRGYSRKAVQEMHAQMAADLDQTRHAIDRLECDNAEIRRDRDRLEQDLLQARQMQESLAASLATTQDLLRSAQIAQAHPPLNVASPGSRPLGLLASIVASAFDRFSQRFGPSKID